MVQQVDRDAEILQGYCYLLSAAVTVIWYLITVSLLLVSVSLSLSCCYCYVLAYHCLAVTVT